MSYKDGNILSALKQPTLQPDTREKREPRASYPGKGEMGIQKTGTHGQPEERVSFRNERGRGTEARPTHTQGNHQKVT